MKMGLAQLFKKPTDSRDLDIAPPYEPPILNTKIRMLQDCRGSNDHLHMELFREGEVYEVTEQLAKLFLEMKVAELKK